MYTEFRDQGKQDQVGSTVIDLRENVYFHDISCTSCIRVNCAISDDSMLKEEKSRLDVVHG